MKKKCDLMSLPKYGLIYKIIMKLKHKHRRSSSLTIGSQKQSQISQEKVNNSVQIDLSNAQIMSLAILQCLTQCQAKAETKQTIIQHLNQRDCGKKQKDLFEIQQQLKSWGRFQTQFLNQRISKNQNLMCLRQKRCRLNLDPKRCAQDEWQKIIIEPENFSKHRGKKTFFHK